MYEGIKMKISVRKTNVMRPNGTEIMPVIAKEGTTIAEDISAVS